MYEEVLADAPEQATAVNNLAFLYARDNRQPYRALEMARRAVATDPDNASKWDTLGWASYRAGRWQEAAAQLQRALQREPEKAVAEYHLAKTLVALRHPELALPHFTAALHRGLPPAESRDTRVILSRSK